MSDTFASKDNIAKLSSGENGLEETGSYGATSRRAPAPCTIGKVLKKGD